GGAVGPGPRQHCGVADDRAGVRLQKKSERKANQRSGDEYSCPTQETKDFMAGRTSRHLPPSSYTRSLVPANIAELVPPLIVEALRHGLPILNHRWHGRFLAEATLVGPEARGSSPVRIVRDEQTRESPGIVGLYPVGEGAGYAGGIVSAAVDGLRSAKSIMARYAPLDQCGTCA